MFAFNKRVINMKSNYFSAHIRCTQIIAQINSTYGDRIVSVLQTTTHIDI